MKPADWWTPQAQQQAFRAVLDGFARPGTRVPATPPGAVLMFLSAVLDESVSLADPGGVLGADLRRLLLAPTAPAALARFVLLDGRRPPEAGFEPALGTLESPEGGATLLLTVDAVGSSRSEATQEEDVVLHLQGPGVAGTRTLAVSGLHPDWLARRAAWVAAYPLGVDIVLAAPDALVALPRTTRIEITAVAGEH
ncbi:phosphonate C-P lyase system protein PhnH [Methylibium petroleiphilum]|uniref:Phosphonate metabolism protein n=1 Tax=Methylibium petroleiphilum (strain ATCC BAA-1232 / LMG 22953 / PM1) TaxID=420662 RepID=A2SNR1_METPP|nr:phosphonate C-P lyase system protein PhnH [Methylibium petroleiphilum]ABM97200.1 phosphonate metabolism protein [Methylibium petroleiphilum PM1]ABM97234.1 phosphonate metabolism protein [Methylibium petroleiphilum PM1]